MRLNDKILANKDKINKDEINKDEVDKNEFKSHIIIISITLPL